MDSEFTSIVVSLSVLCQLVHFAEEYLFQFPGRFPALLGLIPWRETFFVTFNLIWLGIWCAAIACVAVLPRVAVFPLWFLAIASVANGIIHPLLAIVSGGYFPGLWSSPFVAMLGAVLITALLAATRPDSDRAADVEPGGRVP